MDNDDPIVPNDKATLMQIADTLSKPQSSDDALRMVLLVYKLGRNQGRQDGLCHQLKVQFK